MNNFQIKSWNFYPCPPLRGPRGYAQGGQGPNSLFMLQSCWNFQQGYIIWTYEQFPSKIMKYLCTPGPFQRSKGYTRGYIRGLGAKFVICAPILLKFQGYIIWIYKQISNEITKFLFLVHLRSPTGCTIKVIISSFHERKIITLCTIIWNFH